MTVPLEWMPLADMKRIIFHWTAGGHRANAVDKGAYHLLVEGDGRVVRGKPSITGNERPGMKGLVANHTRNLNTGSIGVALCCMVGARERPFDAGRAPMTALQWKVGGEVIAALCHRYGIPVSPRTVLSHAEVQGTLGVQQSAKWDVTRLAFDPTVIGAKACGDLMRAAVAVNLERMGR